MDPAITRVDLTRRAVTRLGAGGLALALAARGLTATAQAAAQDATPTSDPEGVAGSVLGSGYPSDLPDRALAIQRTIVSPGGGLPPHSHPGAVAFSVDGGTWGITILEGTAQVTRASSGGTPAPAEEVELGVELVLTKGDALFAEAFRDQMRNLGDDDVVLLMAALNAEGQDFQIE